MNSANAGGQYVDMGSNWTIGGSVSFHVVILGHLR